ncbi:MAG: phosphate acyltransferase PlsX [Alphaproteobacteria bacterium]|nr:phosphate acyltransferase PlsX [Alphaproteobacteria bacterium]
MAPAITLALDAMGGDNAPDQVVRGAALARERFPEIRFVFFGDEARISPLLNRHPTVGACSTIRHTAEIIADADKPSRALRRGARSSMRLAIDSVRDAEAQGAVSGGNTGALMAMAKFVLKTLPNIDRPAIAGLFPTVKGECTMLDLGANIDCSATTLVQFAVMGAAFARALGGIERPRVALLNVGSEELKGHEALRSAAQVLRERQLPLEFIGYVEGNDVLAGAADVVVTDGFTGNVALKTVEGTAKLYSTFLAKAFRQSLLSRLGYLLARPALNALRARVDPRAYNGAMFVGLNGVVVKSHGSSDAMGFASAIGVAVDMVRGDISARIVADLKQFGSTGAEAPASVAVN